MSKESTWVNRKIAGKPAIEAAVPVAITLSTGSAPVVTGAVTIADASDPSVDELLALVYEVNAKLNALVASLQDG